MEIDDIPLQPPFDSTNDLSISENLLSTLGTNSTVKVMYHSGDALTTNNPSLILLPQKPTTTPEIIVCPECGTNKTYCNGWSNSFFNVKIQRYICRDCGRRFSNKYDLALAKIVAEDVLACAVAYCLNVNDSVNDYVRISAEDTVKNLATETQQTTTCVSEKQKLFENSNINLVIADYAHNVKKERFVNDLTLSKYVGRLKYLAKIGVNLFDPDDFKTKLAFDPVLSSKSNCNKNSICKAYISFVKKYLHMKDVKIPLFEYRTPEYKLPLTEHMEQLYASLSFQMQVFCYTLMATAARPIEALRIEWSDVDFTRKTISINKPAKHGRTRTIPLKGRFAKVIDMLEELKTTTKNCNLQKSNPKKPKSYLYLHKHKCCKSNLSTRQKTSSYTLRHT